MAADRDHALALEEVLPDFDQGTLGQAGMQKKFKTIAKGHHVVSSGVKNLGSGFYGLGRPPLLPRRAEQDEPSTPRLQVHRDRPAPARPHHDIGLVLVEGCLGRPGGQEVTSVRLPQPNSCLTTTSRATPACSATSLIMPLSVPVRSES